jgi:hypothetical protein
MATARICVAVTPRLCVARFRCSISAASSSRIESRGLRASRLNGPCSTGRAYSVSSSRNFARGSTPALRSTSGTSATRGDVRDFLAQDHLEDVGGRVVAERRSLLDHARRDVEPARFQHARHQRHARQRVVRGLLRHFPQPLCASKSP